MVVQTIGIIYNALQPDNLVLQSRSIPPSNESMTVSSATIQKYNH